MYQYYIHKVQSITYFMNINSIIFCDEKEVFWQKWLSLVNTSHCSIINQVPNYKDVMMTTFESMYIIIQNISRQQNNPLLPNFLLNINKSHFLEYDQYMSNRFNSFFFQNHTKREKKHLVCLSNTALKDNKLSELDAKIQQKWGKKF